MEFLYVPDIRIFAFPVNLIAGVLLICGIWTLHRYYAHKPAVRWFSGIQASLIFMAAFIFLLVIEGIWALELFRTWIFILLEIGLLLILGLSILKRIKPFHQRNLLFLLNHTGLWLILAAALLGAPDREEYKMVAAYGQPEYNGMDSQGILHPLPFTVRLDKFGLEYYPHPYSSIPKRFYSALTFKSRENEKQAIVEVNQPACFKGYRLYQDGYDQAKGADSSYTILLIVRDPWIGGVYAGICMLLAGAVGLIINGPVKRHNHGLE